MHRNQTMTDTSHARAHATLIISGDSTSPEFWTAYFDVQPDRVIIKGRPFQLPSGKLSPCTGKLGLWAVESKAAVRSDLLGPHLQYIKSRLGLPRADLRDFMGAQRAKMALWCYWFNETGDRVPDVPDDIRSMMEAMDGTVEIDEYR